MRAASQLCAQPIACEDLRVGVIVANLLLFIVMAFVTKADRIMLVVIRFFQV